MGGRGFLVGDGVFCLFVVLRHPRGGKERKGKGTASIGIRSLVHSFILSFIQSVV